MGSFATTDAALVIDPNSAATPPGAGHTGAAEWQPPGDLSPAEFLADIEVAVTDRTPDPTRLTRPGVAYPIPT